MALTRPKYSQIYDTDWKQSVELATTADVGNLVLANVQPNSIDGITVQTNYRILVKDQNTGAQNGIYLVRNAGTGSNGWWTRSLDAAQSSFVTAGLTVGVVSGTANGGKEFKLTTPDPITLGVTPLTFINPFAAAGAGGANTQVQFNDASILNGTAGLTFNKYSNVLTISNNISTSTLTASGNVSGLYILGDGSKLTGIDATSIQSGTSSVKTYSSSNVAISVGGTANTVVFTSSNVIVSGSIIPSANITYDLGSPTRKFRSAYFSGNTVYIGPESISVSNDGTWTFTSNGGNATMSSSSAMGNIYMDKTNGFMGFNDPTPDFVYDFLAPNDAGEILHIEGGVGTQAFFGARNAFGLNYAAGADQFYAFSGTKDNTNDYALITNNLVRANIQGSSGNVIFTQSITVANDIITRYLGTQEFRATASNIFVRSAMTFAGTNLYGMAKLAVGTENPGSEAFTVLGGSSYFDRDVTITGNLFVNGNTTTFTSNNITLKDSMIYLADNNPADTVDIGFVGSFNNVIRYQHTGFVRDATDGVWKLFANVVPEPTTTIDFTNATYSNLLIGNLTVTGINSTGFINTSANISAGGNVTVANLIVSTGSGQFSGPFNENTTTAGVFVGNLNTTPRIGFFNGNTAQNWQIDNNGGTLRWYTPGVTRMSLDPTGILTVGNILPTANNISNIGSSTSKFNTVHARATQAQYADLAEVYTSDQQYPAGTVVVFGGLAEVMQSHSSHDTRVAGVVSTDPAYLMNSTATGVPVALQGRVPCRVLGPVEQGDRVVSSHIPGVAQRLDLEQYQPGCIIGKALQAVDSADISIIEVVVGRV